MQSKQSQFLDAAPAPRPDPRLQAAVRQLKMMDQLVASQVVRVAALERTEGGLALANARRLLAILKENRDIQRREVDALQRR